MWETLGAMLIGRSAIALQPGAAARAAAATRRRRRVPTLLLLLALVQYQVGDTVTLWVNKVGPYNNPQETCEWRGRDGPGC